MSYKLCLLTLLAVSLCSDVESENLTDLESARTIYETTTTIDQTSSSFQSLNTDPRNSYELSSQESVTTGRGFKKVEIESTKNVTDFANSVPELLVSAPGEISNSRDDVTNVNDDVMSDLDSFTGLTDPIFGSVFDKTDETERRLALNERTNDAIDSVVQKLFSSKKSKADQMNETRELLKSLGDLLDVYNPSRLAGVWNRTQDLHLTQQCQQQMQTYLKELGAGAIWALKMSDASGKYGGGFLWGNNYWVGSATLCYQINEQPMEQERAPFALGFFMLRTIVKLSSHITPTPRSQLLGVCLPLSCTSLDASRLVELSAREAMLDMDRTLQITSVKSPHNAYFITEDPLFWALVVVSTAVFVLLLIGTVLDLYLEYVMDKDRNFSYDNYTFVFSKNIHHNSIRSGQSVVKVEMNAENNNNGALAEDGSGVTTESNSVASDEVIKKPGVLREVMLSFSVRKNMMTICDKSVGADTIPTVHGLRSLSMAWVILGHTCIVAFKYSDNMMYRNVVEKELLFQTINNAAFSVDTFFFISGLLVAFLYFRTTAKHDLSKITKSTGFVSCIVLFFKQVSHKFLFFQCDFHKIFCFRHFRAAASLMVVFLISSWCNTAYIAFSNKHMPKNVDDPLALFDKIYDKPWTRLVLT
ncbi:hypothetical protein LSTR_LSTR010630 [Laodelphax striatellus]|uniref:Nose resistant-to-fluoxetine protein N-terminal domain-containing protein n=1 Tax=Laodelphax striatellus TaxID=195883 RepID=A0A482X4D6_LAOST|nr:hypothetical protein LSTR_LSTR010630 [Laodelphax striatellus]